MIKECRLKKIIVCLILCTFITIPAFAMDSVDAKISKMSKDEVASEYHKIFDLNNIQIKELVERGYTEEEIAKFDTEDFKEIEQTWVITEKQVAYIKDSYPGLEGIDISGWTNADVAAYRTSIMNTIRSVPVPTTEQKAKLKEKGVSLSEASEMLRDYIDYETLLSQPDEELTKYKELIIKKEEKRNEHIKYKKFIRKKHIDVRSE